MSLILVRHALPEVERGVSSKLWGLSEASREDCVLLAHVLPKSVRSIWSSDERKARETAEVLGLRLGLPVGIDAGFAEVDRPQVWDRDYGEVASGYLSGIAQEGWERAAGALERFSAAVTKASSGADGDVVVVNHGLAMTLWVASVADIDVVSWWRDLTFPDAWRVDPVHGTVERLWMGGARGE